MALTVKPDTILLVRDAWLTRPAVTAIFGARMFHRPQGTVYPQLVLSTIDEGEAFDPHMGEARVSHEVLGPGSSDADTAATRLAARTLFAEARQLAGAYPPGTIVACAPLLLVPDPDPATGRARFIVDLVVTTI